MKHKFLLFYSWFIRTVLFFLPDIPLFMRLRGFLYGLGMQSCGKDFQITHDAIIKGLQNVSIGEHVFIGNHTIMLGGGGILIGNEVQIAPHCVLVSGNHTAINGSYRYGISEQGSIIIDAGAWVAANCTIGRNGHLPEGSVLAANSFLNKSFEDKNAIYGGVPAKFIKYS